MSMSCPAVVRLAEAHTATCLEAVSAGTGSPEELERVAEAFSALAEVTAGSISRWWSQHSERRRAEALMSRAALLGSSVGARPIVA